MYVFARSTHSCCDRVSDVVPTRVFRTCSVRDCFYLDCSVCFFGFVRCFAVQLARSVKCYLHRQQVSGLFEEEADEEMRSSLSCDLMVSMSEPDAGGSGATSPSLPAAIEQWEMLHTDAALHPSRFELYAFTSVVCGTPLQV